MKRREVIQREAEYFERIANIKKKGSGEQILRHTDILNAKTAALLRHVSMMAAISMGLFAYLYRPPYSEIDILGVGFVILIVFNIAVSVVCLRGIFITDSGSFKRTDETPQETLSVILWKRRRSFYASLYASYVSSTSLVALILLKVAQELY